MSDESNRLADAAISYAANYGWQVVPLHNLRPGGGCTCKAGLRCSSVGKHPRLTDWQNKASNDAETVAAWWEKWPEANIGVRFGWVSGIVDLECDSPEAEQDFLKLFDGSPPVCPTFQANRGKHRLFRFSDQLPGKAVVHFGALEVRTGNGGLGAQSVFPPSRHASGKVYEWLPGCSPEEVEPPELPQSVLVKLWNLAGEEKPTETEEKRPKSARMALYEQPAVPEGQRDNSLYAEACNLWNEQLGLKGKECFGDNGIQAMIFRRLWAMNIAFCKPPLEEAEVLAKCEGGRKFIAGRASVEQTQQHGRSLTALGLELNGEEYLPGSWRVESINSDPPMARLYAPFLKKPLDLLMDDFDSPTKVHRAVLRATGTVCLDDEPGKWQRIWKGQRKKGAVLRGLQFKLLDAAKQVEAPAEVRRQFVVAEFVWNYLAQARVVEAEKEVMANGPPWKEPDGMVWFSFAAALKDADSFEKADKITRQELSKCVREVAGAENRVIATRNGRRAFMRIAPQGLERLREMVVEWHANGRE